MGNHRKSKNSQGGLFIVSVIEATKGFIVLITGFGLLLFIHKDLHFLAEQLVRHLHLNPARHYPKIFIDAFNNLNDFRLCALALSAIVYSLARFAEAYGLWFQKQWAKWFGFLTGGVYIPLEFFEVLLRVTWPRLTVLIVNLLIVAYLGYALYLSRNSGDTIRNSSQL
jgi:uncharacterized membrane protein (DUF2068 family)